MTIEVIGCCKYKVAILVAILAKIVNAERANGERNQSMEHGEYTGPTHEREMSEQKS